MMRTGCRRSFISPSAQSYAVQGSSYWALPGLVKVCPMPIQHKASETVDICLQGEQETCPRLQTLAWCDPQSSNEGSVQPLS